MILNKINTNLSESLKYAYPDKNRDLFDKLCSINKLRINDFFKNLVSDMYAVNTSIESLQKGMLNFYILNTLIMIQLEKKIRTLQKLDWKMQFMILNLKLT